MSSELNGRILVSVRDNCQHSTQRNYVGTVRQPSARDLPQTMCAEIRDVFFF